VKKWIFSLEFFTEQLITIKNNCNENNNSNKNKKIKIIKKIFKNWEKIKKK
jgi:hypothetical protein